MAEEIAVAEAKAVPFFYPATQSKVEESEGAASPALFGNEAARDDGEIVLSKPSPFDSARVFARQHCYTDGVLTTYHWMGGFWRWNGGFYEPVDDAKITDEVWRFLDGAKTSTRGDGDRQRFLPKSRDVDEVIRGLKAGVSLDAKFSPPRWHDGRAAGSLLVFKNCVVDIETGEVMPPNPALWAHDGADYEFSPEARAPRWEQFLEEVFPGDVESQMTIEEQLGYGMTYETKFEKGALWIGVKRSGKSTMAHIQKRLVGDRAYIGLSFNTLTRGENSCAEIVGKKVAVFADTRFRPARMYGQSFDPGGISHAAAELLLNIIGQDTISVGQKYKSKWIGQLPTKVIITSNETPNLQDTSGVLPSRFIKLAFRQSFYGKEDIELRQKLEEELPGIAARCIEAYRRLCRRGRFIQPKSGLELERRIEAKINPFAAFMQEKYEADRASEGPTVEVFYSTFCQWCEENGRTDLRRSTPKQKLIQQITAIEEWAWLKVFRPHGKQRRYPEIRLLKPREE